MRLLSGGPGDDRLLVPVENVLNCDIGVQQLPGIFSVIGHHVDVICAGYDEHGPSFEDLAGAAIQFEGVAFSAAAVITSFGIGAQLRARFVEQTSVKVNTLPSFIYGVVTHFAMADRSFRSRNAQMRASAVVLARFT